MLTIGLGILGPRAKTRNCDFIDVWPSITWGNNSVMHGNGDITVVAFCTLNSRPQTLHGLLTSFSQNCIEVGGSSIPIL